MRRKLLVQRFVMALTQGKSSVRPIEMQAHDPVRLAMVLECLHDGKRRLSSPKSMQKSLRR